MNRRILVAVCGLAAVAAAAQSVPLTQVASNLASNDVPGRGKLVAQEIPQSPAQKAEELGDLQMARKNYREAVDSYQEAVRLRPNNAVAWNKMGIAHHQLVAGTQFSELTLARNCYQKAVKLNPKYAEAINNLGTVYYRFKNYGRAIRYYQQSLALSPDAASVYANLGAALFSRRKFLEASQAYQKALTLDPEVFDHHNTYGVELQERTDQDLAMFHFILAHTYAANHNQEKALEYLRKAMEEGFHEPKKIYDDPAFAELVKSQSFTELMANPPLAIPR
jgi:tetratricopeptide (TPR) repeat protein